MSELDKLRQKCLDAFKETEQSESSRAFAQVIVWIDYLQRYGRILDQEDVQKLVRGERVIGGERVR